MEKCLICGKQYKTVNHSHLWSQHQVTLSEYQQYFSRAAVHPRKPEILTPLGDGLCISEIKVGSEITLDGREDWIEENEDNQVTGLRQQGLGWGTSYRT